VLYLIVGAGQFSRLNLEVKKKIDEEIMAIIAK